MFCPRTIVNSNKDVSASAAFDGFFSSLKSSNLTEAQHKSLQSLVKKLFNFVSSLKLYALTEENDYLQLLWSIFFHKTVPLKIRKSPENMIHSFLPTVSRLETSS